MSRVVFGFCAWRPVLVHTTLCTRTLFFCVSPEDFGMTSLPHRNGHSDITHSEYRQIKMVNFFLNPHFSRTYILILLVHLKPNYWVLKSITYYAYLRPVTTLIESLQQAQLSAQIQLRIHLFQRKWDTFIKNMFPKKNRIARCWPTFNSKRAWYLHYVCIVLCSQGLSFSLFLKSCYILGVDIRRHNKEIQ